MSSLEIIKFNGFLFYFFFRGILTKFPKYLKFQGIIKMSFTSSETRSCIERHFYFLVGILGLSSIVLKPSPNLLSSLQHVILSSIWIGTLVFVTRDFGKTSCLLPHYLLIISRWNSFSYSSSSALFTQNWITQQLHLQDDQPNNSTPFIQWPTNEHLQQAHLVDTFIADLWQWPKLPLPTCEASSSSR
jgi:hypothetical protein